MPATQRTFFDKLVSWAARIAGGLVSTSDGPLDFEAMIDFVPGNGNSGYLITDIQVPRGMKCYPTQIAICNSNVNLSIAAGTGINVCDNNGSPVNFAVWLTAGMTANAYVTTPHNGTVSNFSMQTPLKQMTGSTAGKGLRLQSQGDMTFTNATMRAYVRGFFAP